MRALFAGAVLLCACAALAGGVSCPVGTVYHEASASCVVCPAGKYCANQELAVPCAPGQFCPEGSTAPRACPSGSHCPDPSLRMPCPGGTHCAHGSRSATPCPAGTFCPDPSILAPCPTGSYCPQGSVRHYMCPKNTYADAPRSALCTPCPEGTATQGIGAASFANCTLPGDGRAVSATTAAAGGIAGLTGVAYAVAHYMGFAAQAAVLPLAGHMH